MARTFDPGRVAQHGFEYQKFVYYYLISYFKTKYDKYYYEGKEDIHFESSNPEEKLKLFVQVKTANLTLKDKKKILIKWLSIGEIADKYILFCEKNNDYDISLITDDVIKIIKNAKDDSPLSNVNIAYKKYISNGGFDETKLRADIKLIKDNFSKMDTKSVETMFSELRGQMKAEAENDSVIDSTLESRIYYILTKILSKIHNEYVDDMNCAVEITYNEYMNYYIESRNTYPCGFFDNDYTALKKSVDVSTLIDDNLREVRQLKILNLSDGYIIQQIINEIFYKEFRKFYFDINQSNEIENVEEIAFQNNIEVVERAKANGQINPTNIYFDTVGKAINHPFITKMKGADFCYKGCYIYLTSDEANKSKQISWEIE